LHRWDEIDPPTPIFTPTPVYGAHISYFSDDMLASEVAKWKVDICGKKLLRYN